MNAYKNEFVGCHLHLQKFDSLRSIREKANWNSEEERHVFVGQLNCLFSDWKCQYQAEEIDWLLTESIRFREEECHNRSGELIIKFVANSGYKYQPKIEQDGKPLERRTTAVHHAARSGFLNKDIMIRDLLKIYNNFEVNYTDSSGLAHFHVACAIGCDDVVEKFLELGQDPNLLVHAIDYSPLHFALANCRKKVARLLLKSGADPNLANPEGSTALHLICKMDSPNASIKVLFEISDEKSQPLLLDAQDKEGKTALHLALENGHREVVQLLLERDANPNLAHPEGSTALHLICKMDSPKALMKLLLENGKRQSELIDAQDNKGKTALHWALKNGRTVVAEWLLRKGADPNLADKAGSTALHIISQEPYNDLAEMIFEISDENHRHVLVDAQDNEGNTPLHITFSYNKNEVARLLLRRGANPTLANKYGDIPLHIGCVKYDNVEFFSILFELSNDKYHPVQLNAKNKRGWTPLHSALYCRNPEAAKFLLRRGADPHLTDDLGNTILHVMSKDFRYENLVEMFFEVSDELNQQLQIDARDSRGNTPLHLALEGGNKKVIEQLLRRGADPNLAKKRDKSTPLHLICKSDCDNDLIKIFLKIMNEDRRETVLIDARDKYGLTPLQYAVARLSPNVVDVLLDHGADLSNFVFPKKSLFDFGVKLNDSVKIKITSGILAVVERLETRGYELSRRDALTIMKLFAKYKLFVKSADLEEPNWQDHEELTREAKETMISPSLSIFDLLQMRPREVAKRITFKKYFEFASNKRKLLMLQKEGFEACVVAHLGEKLSRRFFQSWTLHPFWNLIHNRLPLECCDMILDNLTNKDLYHIFVSAGEQSS